MHAVATCLANIAHVRFELVEVFSTGITTEAGEATGKLNKPVDTDKADNAAGGCAGASLNKWRRWSECDVAGAGIPRETFRFDPFGYPPLSFCGSSAFV